MTHRKKRALTVTAAVAAVLLLALGVTNFLQTDWSHRHEAYRPDQPMEDLRAVLQKEERTDGEYELLFRQTGLSGTAVDELLEQGRASVILEAQQGVFHAPDATCVSLIGGRFTCEDLLLDEEGERVTSVPIAPLKAGDILVSFSTHTLGWRHGHAGLVVDPARNAVLEAVQIGMNSYQAHVKHWQSYSTFMVLRVKDAAAELGRRVADYAKRMLDDMPYSLLPGISCPKEAEARELPGVHCAFLPWHAWNHFGVDLDENGGPIVTVGDLARSEELEVVQVFGMDPELLMDRQSGME